MDLPQISISELENQILAKNYPQAELLLSQIMQHQTATKMEFNLPPANRTLTNEQKMAEGYQVVEHLAAMLTVLLSDKAYTPSPNMLQYYYIHKRFLTYIFMASSYRNTEHIIRNLGLDKKSEFNKQEIQRLLVLLTPESSVKLPWETLAKHMPADVSQAYLGLLSTNSIIMTPTLSEQLNYLAGLAKHLPTINAPKLRSLNLLTLTYFHVSNFTGSDKYVFKQWAARCYQQAAAQHLLEKVVVKEPVTGQKPTLVLVHEYYRSGHAMYRCYHSLFLALKSYFHVVAVVLENEIDEVAEQDFDQVLKVKDPLDAGAFLNHIKNAQPDVVLYASIGMSHYAALLATQRLAKVQIACAGHPSSSYIDNIDYLLFEDFGKNHDDMANILSEKWLPYPHAFTPMGCSPYKVTATEKDTEVVNILVNGVVQKVSPQTLRVCQQLTEKSDKPLHFHFFMAEAKQDIEYYATHSVLRRLLPNSTMHGVQSYNDYMNTLAKFDFAIATVPFGGANSNLDVIRLGIPKLFVYDGVDLPGMTDYQIWSSVGIMDGYCENTDAMLEKGLAWINDPQLLSDISDKLKADDIQALVNQDVKMTADNRILEAIKTVL